MTRILVAEDDGKQADLLASYLRVEGHEVTVAHDGIAALEQVRRARPDLLLLDVMMPGLDGLEVCRAARAENRPVAVIMVTARGSDRDQITGLELGADDYVVKPYSMRQLMARVRAVLRRTATADAPPAAREVGGLVVDSARCEVTVDGAVVELTAREFGIVEVLARRPGQVWSRRQLLEEVSGFDARALERTVDMHVLNLRRKIEPDPAAPSRVLTVKGRGYKLADPGTT